MRIYFMGICGTAMGNAALLARAAGHEVIGADSGVYPPMSNVLSSAGIAIHEGYDPVRLEQLAPELVVIGNAMSRGNPEIEWLLDTRKIEFTSLPAMLNRSILQHRRNIVVCGTHGKTTTTAMTAFLLRENGLDPGFLIGGVPLDPPVGNHLGALTDPFVIEGDEYDSAFFDKRSKFIHYAPSIALINNLEFDHADIFRDLADVQRTFAHLTRIVPRNGWIVMNGDDDNLKALGSLGWTRVLRVGMEPHNDVCLTDFSEDAAGAGFSLTWKGKLWAKIQWSLHGRYNARNAAMAATAAALSLSPASIHASTTAADLDLSSTIRLEGLAKFRGVKRRQEILLRRKNLTVIEDFGHHPTALAEALISFRDRFKGARVVAVFEPRSNSARTKTFQSGFSRALSHADEVYLGAVNRAEKLNAEERFDSEAVVQHLETHGVHAFAFANNDTLLEALKTSSDPSHEGARVIVFFTNGSFDGIIPRFVAATKD